MCLLRNAEAAIAKCIQLFGGLDTVVNAVAIHLTGTFRLLR